MNKSTTTGKKTVRTITAVHRKTPLRKEAFQLSDQEKIERIQTNVEDILHTLGMDMTDDSLRGTPKRVAKMFVKELFGGLHPDRKPNSSTFENKYKYGEMLVEKNITLYSTCEHHLLPIVGKAHIAYISKWNGGRSFQNESHRGLLRQRPQVQERLTLQIVQELQEVLGTEDVACLIDAKHLCVNSRGIRDIDSSTVTAEYGGRFKEEAMQRAFLDYINSIRIFIRAWLHFTNNTRSMLPIPLAEKKNY